MKQPDNNFAFIDAQNLNLGVKDQGWQLDFARFRVYLRDKYAVTEAYIFIGYVKGNESLYTALQRAGYVCIFKPTLELPDGSVKGNVDAELVLHAMINIEQYNQAIIVSGDGDFHCLIEHLLGQRKLCALMVPNHKKYSALLKRKDFRPYTRSINDIRNKVERKKKGPH
jgi:uncharacterized LabA/DUF88 family protein